MLNDEQLTELEALGAAFMAVPECAIILGVPVDALKAEVEDSSSYVHKAYERGRLKSLCAIRQAVIKSAADGSSPAQALALELEKQARISNV
jgi:hypothetical protein